ncbi:MAG: hypothetical protein ACJ8F7_14325 [Gemmataceae bacterium]
MLGERIADGSARLLFGEWLAERGDWRADGYLWLARWRKEPSRAYRTFDWWHVDSNCREEITLPGAMWELLPVPPHDGFPQAKEFPTRQAAEEAVCRLIADHPGRF